MFELAADNAACYLGYPCSATALGGGVSNTVVLIESHGRRFVLKQSLGKLRVEQPWFADRHRIFRESSAMRLIAPALPAGSVPEILFEDRENFLFAMTAAPPRASPWKDLLLSGTIDLQTAASVARILGSIIQTTWKDSELEAVFGDQTIFDQLRIDPYYRHVARVHPDLELPIHHLIEQSGRRRFCMVHGDWSPKNLLISNSHPMAIDFEVVHFGDPSFDAAFLLNHLLLKSYYRPQWCSGYRAAARQFWSILFDYLPSPREWFEPAVVGHLGALLLARIDGKSPAEYIQDETLKSTIRNRARSIILNPPPLADLLSE